MRLLSRVSLIQAISNTRGPRSTLSVQDEVQRASESWGRSPSQSTRAAPAAPHTPRVSSSFAVQGASTAMGKMKRNSLSYSIQLLQVITGVLIFDIENSGTNCKEQYLFIKHGFCFIHELFYWMWIISLNCNLLFFLSCLRTNKQIRITKIMNY